MADGGPQTMKQRGVRAPLPVQGRGRVPVPMAPSLPIAGGPTREPQHEGLRLQRREQRREREKRARETARRRAERDARKAERDSR